MENADADEPRRPIAARIAARGRRAWRLPQRLLAEAGVGLLAGIAVYAGILANLQDGLRGAQLGQALVASTLSGLLALLTARAGGFAVRRGRHAPPAGPTEDTAPTPARPLAMSNLHPRNQNFTGREAILADLATRFGDPAAASGPVGQVLYGLGGVGKTQLALEYAHRRRADYDVVWWIAAEEGTTVAAELAALARRLGVAEVADQADMTDALWNVLRDGIRWLLIFDNAENGGDLEPYWPAIGGHVLVTSRNPHWAGLAGTVEVDVLDRAESVAFLRSRVATDVEATRDLADALGDLPLALEQAAAYVSQTKITVSAYVELVRDRLPDVLHRGEPFAHKEPVATTWSIALDQLNLRAPAAAELLTLCAMLAPDDIPRGLPVQGAARLPDRLREAVADPLTYADAVGALVRFSLVSAHDDSLSVHRLVQAVVRTRAGPADEPFWATRALHLIADAFPFATDEPASWPGCERMLPHALTVVARTERLGVEPDRTAELLTSAGSYLAERFRLKDAASAFQRALAIDESAHGPQHPLVAVDLGYLAAVAQSGGELHEARQYMERAVAITSAAYGPDHEAVAEARNSLGRTLQNLGEWPAARTELEEALEILMQVFSPDHPRIAAVRNTLGGVLQDLDDLAGARDQLEQALAVDEAAFGPDDPAVASICGNLGRVLQQMGETDAARAQLERALEIDERRYGSSHPRFAVDLNNLGRLLHDLGDLTGARRLLERALEIDEETLGSGRYQVAMRANNLGGVLQDLGDVQGARAHYERALTIIERSFGPQHRSLAVVRSNLGTLLRQAGDESGAREQFALAVDITTATFGPDNPETQRARSLLERSAPVAGPPTATYPVPPVGPTE
ncbi:FxSxx-COOH system tetratricopeptide repeat protein [Cryptosporangium arvum]|uniref:TPR repeat-containing protein n=1 Tax=Cryptosporangium arvum DSM 44712 TaxID=927661 RepID=A0A010ZV41_9ACTN|nr:FxSxx-COOH system tetratricopeptide repeat protein [Cryptosporangium arvum]EXG82564.1 TPR repeat-containing protein [Cryptosporangium arvum DSM 44712]